MVVVPWTFCKQPFVTSKIALHFGLSYLRFAQLQLFLAIAGRGANRPNLSTNQ